LAAACFEGAALAAPPLGLHESAAGSSAHGCAAVRRGLPRRTRERSVRRHVRRPVARDHWRFGCSVLGARHDPRSSR